MHPLVSVIMPVYNQGRYLAETIESVLGQTYAEFEFLLTDDGSTDNSAEIIRHYAEKDERIVPNFQENMGKSITTNNLVSKAVGKYAAFLDADDLMVPDRLEKQVAFHLENPEVDATSCHCFYINEKGNVFGKQYYPGLRNAADCRMVKIKNEVIQCAFTGLMVLRISYMEAGGLSSTIWPGEDFDFFNRLVEQGYILVIIQETLMKYRIHSSAVTVKDPLFTFERIGWMYQCIALRRSGQPEITFEEYSATRKKDPSWVKFNRYRLGYAQIYFRKAGLSMMSKKYLHFFYQFMVASFLAPSHILLKLTRLSKNL
jgi:glycosyltransferase involved in cell wall biosynthesis